MNSPIEIGVASEASLLVSLKTLFEGKRVRITHKESDLGIIFGRCTSVALRRGRKMVSLPLTVFVMKLKGGNAFYFCVDASTPMMVEGPLPGHIGGRRRIELVASAR